jgi:hypothetical protein
MFSRNWILVCTVFMIGHSVAAQVDYDKLRHRFTLSCGIPDSLTLVAQQTFVDSVASCKITRGEAEFLTDRGWVYYMRYVRWSLNDDLIMATRIYETSWQKFQTLSSLWALGTLYRQSGECERSLAATEQYLELAEPSIIDYQQIYLRYKFCCGK